LAIPHPANAQVPVKEKCSCPRPHKKSPGRRILKPNKGEGEKRLWPLLSFGLIGEAKQKTA